MDIHDRRVKRWRHVDLGAGRRWIECELRLLSCRDCGARMEPVEIRYRRHYRYLTSVADHQTGAIVRCSTGRNSATLQAFFDELGDRKPTICAVSIDMSGEYPDAEICFRIWSLLTFPWVE